MEIQSGKPDSKHRVLVNWDLSHRALVEADQVMRTFRQSCVYAVYAQPHEAIRSYGSISTSRSRPEWRPNRLIENLRHKFRELSRGLESFQNVELTLLFGERISEISTFANQIRADHVLSHPFVQTSFSKWIHGNLNQRLETKTDGQVIWINQTSTPLQKDLQKGYS